MTGYYAYIRVSTQKQGQKGSSLQEQRAAIEAYARRHNLSITEWFEERETAAKRGRRVFNRLLKQLERNKAAGVIIHKVDRSARNLRDWADLGILMDRGIRVYLAHEDLDLTSRGGRLSADIQAVIAADYIRNLREEVLKGFYGRLKQGFYPLRAPLGYLDNGKAKPKTLDPATAPHIRAAFELYASGQFTLEALVEELDARGLRNRHGRRVSLNALSRILNNDFYTGLIRIRSRNEVFQGNHEPLITMSLFRRVQARLSGKVRHLGLKYDFVYRRALRCIHCNNTVLAEKQKGHIYYRCHTKNCPRGCVREEDIDSQVSRALGALALPEDEMAALESELDSLIAADAQEHGRTIQATQLQLAQVEERLHRLTDAFLDGSIERELFEERKSALIKERLNLRDELEELASGNGSPRAKVARVLEHLKTASESALRLDSAGKLDLLKSATSNLMMDGKNLLVAWFSDYSVVANRPKVTDCRPYRGTPRTFCQRRNRKKACRRCLVAPHIARLAHDLYTAMFRRKPPNEPHS